MSTLYNAGLPPKVRERLVPIPEYIPNPFERPVSGLNPE